MNNTVATAVTRMPRPKILPPTDENSIKIKDLKSLLPLTRGVTVTVSMWIHGEQKILDLKKIIAPCESDDRSAAENKEVGNKVSVRTNVKQRF